MEGGNLRDADIFGARHQQRQPQQVGTTASSPFQTSRTSYIIIVITVVSPQDVQLWDVKAKQLKSWVDRGLLNVKLLDRTLAYFQNQSSYLQYIRTSAANRLIGEVVQSRRRPLLGPSPG